MEESEKTLSRWMCLCVGERRWVEERFVWGRTRSWVERRNIYSLGEALDPLLLIVCMENTDHRGGKRSKMGDLGLGELQAAGKHASGQGWGWR